MRKGGSSDKACPLRRTSVAAQACSLDRSAELVEAEPLGKWRDDIREDARSVSRRGTSDTNISPPRLPAARPPILLPVHESAAVRRQPPMAARRLSPRVAPETSRVCLAVSACRKLTIPVSAPSFDSCSWLSANRPDSQTGWRWERPLALQSVLSRPHSPSACISRVHDRDSKCTATPSYCRRADCSCGHGLCDEPSGREVSCLRIRVRNYHRHAGTSAAPALDNPSVESPGPVEVAPGSGPAFQHLVAAF